MIIKKNLAFLDLKKAYESVPIGNILYKLDALGIRGKCFQFIKNIYLISKASVKIDDQYLESFNIMKGVRQDCPLSPILFNLFINDIFNDFSELGISFRLDVVVDFLQMILFYAHHQELS